MLMLVYRSCLMLRKVM